MSASCSSASAKRSRRRSTSPRSHRGDAWIENYLRDTNAEYNAALRRIAFKMATGSGKTVVKGRCLSAAAAPARVRARCRRSHLRLDCGRGHGHAVPQAPPSPGGPEGSTRHVGFDTAKTVFATRADKCHVSHVAEDSGWESKMAQTLESMDEVVSYVKNQGVQFTIPYSLNGDEKQYFPDSLVRIGRCEAGDGRRDDLLTLIVEVTGEGRKDKAAKVAAARNLWIPAVNNHGGSGGGGSWR